MVICLLCDYENKSYAVGWLQMVFEHGV